MTQLMKIVDEKFVFLECFLYLCTINMKTLKKNINNEIKEN